MEFSETNLQVIIALLTSLFLASVAIPTIVTVASKKGLVSAPNGRTSHRGHIPVLGGLALFLGVGISIAMWTKAAEFPEINGIFGASLILMSIGLKDDILVIDPHKKLLGEVMAALLIIFFGGIHLTGIQAGDGILDLGYTASVVFSLFIIVLIINAFNLIDGIDGLASGIGILATVVYGYWFYRVGEVSLAVFSFATTGALAGFFYFNVFGGKNKIFMGDTGALLLGLVLAVLTIRFLELNLTSTSTYQMRSAPAIAIALLGIPLFDTARVFILRIVSYRSPFRADRNHIHHLLVDLHFTHLESALLLLGLNALLVILAITLRSLNNLLLIGILAATFTALSTLAARLRRHRLVIRSRPREMHETRLGRFMTAYGTQNPLAANRPWNDLNGNGNWDTGLFLEMDDRGNGKENGEKEREAEKAGVSRH